MTATPTTANSAILRVSMIASPAQSSARPISRRMSSLILNSAMVSIVYAGHSLVQVRNELLRIRAAEQISPI
jgi:hypothetical protein